MCKLIQRFLHKCYIYVSLFLMSMQIPLVPQLHNKVKTVIGGLAIKSGVVRPQRSNRTRVITDPLGNISSRTASFSSAFSHNVLTQIGTPCFVWIERVTKMQHRAISH